MPLFNNRKGNAGSGKGFLTSIGHKRAAVKNLHSEAGWAGNHLGHGMQGARQGDPFGSNNGPFSAPNGTQRIEAATSKARAAGVSERKINKVVNKAHEIGFKQAKPNPFSSK